MEPSIQIYPIKQLYALLSNDPRCAQNAVAILSSSYTVQETKIPIPHITEIYDDVDREIPGRSLSTAAAHRIANFIKGMDPHVKTVFVCCDSGMSRSSAIAAVVHRFYGINDSAIWNSPHYHPNPFVFRLLLECLDMPVDDAIIDRLIAINRLSFKNAIRRSSNT